MPPFILSIPYELTESVPRLLKRQCGRTLHRHPPFLRGVALGAVSHVSVMAALLAASEVGAAKLAESFPRDP